MMTKTYHSIDQTKIKILCDSICDNIDDLLSHFDLEYKNNGKFISLSCPIHGGDNKTAINIYPEGESYRGNWKCRTHQCEKTFKGSIIGFIRGVLSHKQHGWQENGNKTVTFNDALKFASDFVDLDIENMKMDNTQKNKQNFVSQVSILTSQQQVSNKPLLTRNKIRQILNLPSQYFLDRGFSAEILDKYDIGDCLNKKREMGGRAVVPIYDNNHKFMIGCSGRSIDSNIKPKWKHSDGFKAENSLYNFWYAKDHISSLREVILVESPGNVWKLEMAGIHNGLAMFGSSLTDRQKTLLDTSGAMTIMIITDSDDAGEEARKQISKKCEKTYNIKHIRVSKNDIAELSIKEIEIEIKSKIKT
jgi:5S rRNA maturation endonuclease (ribonuclease M5)